MNNVRALAKLSQTELERGNAENSSWHASYSDSAYIYVGGLAFELTEGDVLCVFSQYGEVLDVQLVRDRATGKSRGFGFLKYEDQRSTVLAVDNLNAAKVLGRTLRVDHCAEYRRRDDEEDVYYGANHPQWDRLSSDEKEEWKTLVEKYGGNAAPELTLHLNRKTKGKKRS